MDKSGKISVNLANNIASIKFSHPKSNSLPGQLLKEITRSINKLANDKNANVIVLRSEGDGFFVREFSLMRGLRLRI